MKSVCYEAIKQNDERWCLCISKKHLVLLQTRQAHPHITTDLSAVNGTTIPSQLFEKDWKPLKYCSDVWGGLTNGTRCGQLHLRLRRDLRSMCTAVNKQGTYLRGSYHAQSKTKWEATAITCSVQLLANKNFKRLSCSMVQNVTAQTPQAGRCRNSRQVLLLAHSVSPYPYPVSHQSL